MEFIHLIEQIRMEDQNEMVEAMKRAGISEEKIKETLFIKASLHQQNPVPQN